MQTMLLKNPLVEAKTELLKSMVACWGSLSSYRNKFPKTCRGVIRAANCKMEKYHKIILEMWEKLPYLNSVTLCQFAALFLMESSSLLILL